LRRNLIAVFVVTLLAVAALSSAGLVAACDNNPHGSKVTVLPVYLDINPNIEQHSKDPMALLGIVPDGPNFKVVSFTLVDGGLSLKPGTLLNIYWESMTVKKGQTTFGNDKFLFQTIVGQPLGAIKIPRSTVPLLLLNKGLVEAQLPQGGEIL